MIKSPTQPQLADMVAEHHFKIITGLVMESRSEIGNMILYKNIGNDLVERTVSKMWYLSRKAENRTKENKPTDKQKYDRVIR